MPDPTAIPAREFALVAPDGHRLAATEYRASGAARGAVLIVGAMAVPQSFYSEFARWLADEGWQVVTFDYRGIARSAPPSLKGFEADILTWARADCRAALAHAQALAPGRPVVWVGHSLGGQILAMTPGNESLAAAVTVASGVGYWRENAYPLRLYSWLLWFGIAPIATALCGFFPGRRLRMVGDLPKGVIEQWSRWCRHPEYAVGTEGEPMRERYRRFSKPLLSFSFTDDEYMSASNVAVLHAFYENARREMRRLAPAECGLARIGHFGFFRRSVGEKLWPVMREWVEGALRAKTQPPAFGSSPSCDSSE